MFLQVSGAEEILLLLISIVISMVVHEAMHGYVAYWLGDTTAEQQGRLTFNPLRSIDPIYTILMPIVFIVIFQIPLIAAKPVPINPRMLKYGDYGAALVALAGPLTNLALALIGSILFKTIGSNSATTLNDFLIIFTEVNVVVMIFNLIPFPPLDGSRVLYAFAPDALKEIMQRIEAFGLISIMIFVLIIFRIPAVSNTIGNLETHVINFLL